MNFNISEWSLRHASFVWFLMVIAIIAGVMSFINLGREEDPSFEIKTMVVSAQWPGATVNDMMNQVTERIENELKQIDELDYTRSFTVPGQTTILVNLEDSTKGDRVRQVFGEVRNRISDIWHTLPQGTYGPFFNDQFGAVYGNIYAFTDEGAGFRVLREEVDRVQKLVRDVPNAGSISIVGTQDEAIYLDFSVRQMASLGIDLQSVIKSIQEQNAVTPSGTIQTDGERVFVRTDGAFVSEQSVADINLLVNGRYFKLTDIATVSRGYVDPPTTMFRYNGEPAIALAVAMKGNGNLLEFGEALEAEMEQAVADMPLGIGYHHVSNQPEIVEEAIGGFTKALIEAVVIVMIVSLVSLGLRAGMIVALAVPLTLTIVFVFMEYMGISLQRISLGALIIALGLLVDDAMITVEMMVSRLELGESRHKAAVYAFTSTAFPMLTGTLVTVAGFMPIALNSSLAGEYTVSMFVVIALALLTSWVVAVLFAPLIGVHLLPKQIVKKHHGPSAMGKLFIRSLHWAMTYRWATIAATAALFIVALLGITQLSLQFFPSSDRSELTVEFALPQNASILETQAQMDRFEAHLTGDADIDHWSSYVGQGALRFYLPLDQQLANPFFGQIVIVTKSLEARDHLQAKLEAIAREEFVGTEVTVGPLVFGLPVGRPLLYRVSGPDIDTLRTYSADLASRLSAHPEITNITFDWGEPARTLAVNVNQDRARQLGISSSDVSSLLNAAVNGQAITQVRDDTYLVNVVARASAEDRTSLDMIGQLQVPTATGKVVPLLSFASVSYEQTQPIVWRRDGVPTMSVRGVEGEGANAITTAFKLESVISAFRDTLPAGYSVETGGLIEGTMDAALPLLPVLPGMLLIMAVILMVQLQSISKLILVVSVAPLGLIGVVAALLLFDKPLGFIAVLGVLALVGIIIRNSVILIDQITTYEKAGKHRWDAVREATEHRMRPILLTAAAASLGMIPIATEVFWGPMAFAMIGGIIAATLLTLYFLPALYVAWYRVKEPEQIAEPEPEPIPAA